MRNIITGTLHHQRERRHPCMASFFSFGNKSRWWWWLLWCSVFAVLLVTAVIEHHYQTTSLISIFSLVSVYHFKSDTSENEIILHDGGEDMILNKDKQLNPCVDIDDDPIKSWKSPKKCNCPDPTNSNTSTAEHIAMINEENEDWLIKHEDMIRSAAKSVSQQDDLDVVMLGDSITNRWNRHEALQTFFNKTSSINNNTSSSLQGLALGVGGDSSLQLLWHLQNGLLASESLLQPKIWLILIGTNDIGRRLGCSKRTTLIGILQVARYLRQHRPYTPIILHGLLPRGSSRNYALNKYWNQIIWINQELKHYCNLHDNFYYLDSSNLFLKQVNTQIETTSSTFSSSSSSLSNSSSTATMNNWIIDSKLMRDALHPTAKGYQKWAPRIVEHVRSIIDTKMVL